MSRSSLSWPISILAGFGVFVVLLFVGTLNPDPAYLLAADLCPTTAPTYPGCYRTAVAENKTATAAARAAQSGTQAARTQLAAQGTCVRTNEETYPCPTEGTGTPENDTTNDNSNNNNNNSGNNQQATPTSTFTPTATTAVTQTVSAQPTAEETPTATRSAAPADDGGQTAAPTPTPLLPAGVTSLVCIPGETVEITGTTRPSAPLLLFFGERPVGGGLSDGGGAYRLRLQVGNERPGLYLVEVRERGSRALVDQYGCEVPAFTPTPTAAQ